MLAACGLRRVATGARSTVPPTVVTGARSSARSTLVTGAVLVLAAVLAVPGFLSLRSDRAKNVRDYRSAAALVAAHTEPGQVILFGPNSRHLGTTRVTAVAYPAPFVGLADPGVGTPAEQDGSLWGTEAGAAELGRRLEGRRELVLLSETTGGPAAGPAQVQALRAGGWTPADRWHSSVWTLTRYRR